MSFLKFPHFFENGTTYFKQKHYNSQFNYYLHYDFLNNFENRILLTLFLSISVIIFNVICILIYEILKLNIFTRGYYHQQHLLPERKRNEQLSSLLLYCVRSFSLHYVPFSSYYDPSPNDWILKTSIISPPNTSFLFE